MIQSGHRVAEQLHQPDQHEIADRVAGERVAAPVTRGAEPVLEQLGGQLGVRPVRGERGQRLPQVAGGSASRSARSRPLDPPSSPTVTTAVMSTSVGAAAQRAQRGGQPVPAAEGHHPAAHSRPRSRCWAWAERRASRRRVASSSAIATLRCLPPVQPTATVR